MFLKYKHKILLRCHFLGKVGKNDLYDVFEYILFHLSYTHETYIENIVKIKKDEL